MPSADLKSHKTILQIHCPVVVSSSISEVIDTSKLVKYYERLCAFVYTRYIMKGVSKTTGASIVNAALRYVPFFVALGVLVKPLLTYIFYRSQGLSKKEAIGLTIVGPKAYDIIKDKKQAGFALLEQDMGKIDVTEVVIDREHLSIQFFAHILEDRFTASSKELLSYSMAHNRKELLRKEDKFAVSPATDVQIIALNVVGYIISASDEEEIGELLDSGLRNKVVVDFANDVVRSVFVTPQGKQSFVSSIKNVLMKPDSESISLTELVSLLRGTQKA